MLIRALCGLFVLACLPVMTRAQELKKFTPDQLEVDEPEGIVTIIFKVDKVVVAPSMIWIDKAPIPIALVSSGAMRDKDGHIWIAFTGKALDQIIRLGLDGGNYFLGKKIE